MDYSQIRLDPFCIFEFIDCERNNKCNFCDLSSSRGGISRLCSNLYQIIKEKGIEDSLRYYEKLRYIFGIGTVNVLKETLGDREISPDFLSKSLSSQYTSFGMEYHIKSGNDFVEATIYKCPFYTELFNLGLDNSVINAFCERGSEGEYSAFMKVFPRLEHIHVHRKKINDTCRECYRINNN